MATVRAGTAMIDVPEVDQQDMMTGGRSVSVGGVKDHCSNEGHVDSTHW